MTTMSDPFREQRFSAKDVRRIVRRAADLAEHDAATASVERSLTREELERAALELGLPASAVARAASPDEGAEVDDEKAAERRKHSAFIGAPTRLVLEAEVEGEPGESDREDLVEDIRDVIGETGSVERVGKTMVWKLDPGYRGQGRELSVRLRSRHGRTRIVVEERLARAATGLFVGLGVGGGIGPIGAYIAVIANAGPVGLLFPLAWIPLMLLLARTIYGALAHRRERALRKLMRRMTARAAGWSAPDVAARRRVAQAARSRIETEGEPEEEEEADGAAVGARARRS
jgi:hypothetical protein